MHPLIEQVKSPALLCAGAIYILLAGVSVLLLVRADRHQRWLALLCMAGAAAISFQRFSTTPPGVMFDTLEYVPRLVNRNWTWGETFGENSCVHILGWNALPWYLVWRLADTLLAERIVGLVWHLLLVGATVAAPLTAGPSGLVAGAMVASTPTALWLSRHAAGSDILLQQYLLLYALARSRDPKVHVWWMVLAGLLLALLQYGYAAAHITVMYPLLFLARRASWRQCLTVYAVSAIGTLPLLCTWGGMLNLSSDYMWDTQVHTAGALALKAWYVFASLGSKRHAMFGAGAWSYPGAQTLPLPTLALLLVGAGCALVSPLGRIILVAALLGALPNIVSNVGHLPTLLANATAGWSHRVMMMFIPMTLLIAGIPSTIARRTDRQWLCAALIAAVIVFSGVRTWLSEDFWEPYAPKYWFALHDAVADELARAAPDTRIRTWPHDPIVWFIAYRHGWKITDLDLQPADLEVGTPLTVVWRDIDPQLLARLREATRDRVTIDYVAPRITVTHFPAGSQGLLDGFRFQE